MNNLVLVGFSCSGKTTIGRIAARRLGLRFVDTDRLIEETAGKSVSAIFQEEGETRFREIESEVVERVCAEHDQVVSTGGGAFMNRRSRDLLRNGNLVIYLRVRPSTVIERLEHSRARQPRPLLECEDPLQRVTEMMAARQRGYGYAHVAVDGDRRAQHEVATDVTRHWLRWRRDRTARGTTPAGSHA